MTWKLYSIRAPVTGEDIFTCIFGSVLSWPMYILKYRKLEHLNNWFHLTPHLVISTCLNTYGHETFVICSHQMLWCLTLNFIMEVLPTSKSPRYHRENFIPSQKALEYHQLAEARSFPWPTLPQSLSDLEGGFFWFRRPSSSVICILSSCGAQRWNSGCPVSKCLYSLSNPASHFCFHALFKNHIVVDPSLMLSFPKRSLCQ